MKIESWDIDKSDGLSTIAGKLVNFQSFSVADYSYGKAFDGAYLYACFDLDSKSDYADGYGNGKGLSECLF